MLVEVRRSPISAMRAPEKRLAAQQRAVAVVRRP
jgi:hypothetical protein